MPPKKRQRFSHEPVSELTSEALRTGKKLDVMARKEDLDEKLSFIVDHSESKNLYLNDGRLARSQLRKFFNIERLMVLDDISPSAAWKEAIFRFRIEQKLMPETFCRALAEQAWQKYVDFRIQKKQNLRIRCAKIYIP